MAAVSRRTEPTPPSRPSISPLSTTKSSPVASREDAMSTINGQDGLGRVQDMGMTDAPELADDRSSSLSEPEDEDDEGAQLLDVRYRSTLGDDRAGIRSNDIDSEAETERLDQTPSRLRKRADSTGKTPSKLSHTAMADELSDVPSPSRAVVNGASSTSTAGTIGKKRKRSDTADSSLTSAESLLGESPRKRSQESPTVHEHIAEETDAAEGAIDPSAQSKASSREEDSAADQEPAAVQSTKGGYKGRRAKVKGRSRKDASKDTEASAANSMDVDDEPAEETMAKSHDELKHKGAASSLFEDLAKQFASFHDKLFNEKLAALASEVEMLTQADCQHPEYLRQAACVDARYAKQVSEVHAYYRYKMQALRITTLAERSQLHSQYFQTARELREEQAYQLGEDWYKIQKERRQSSHGQDGQYILKFPTKRSEQLRNQAKYNQEVSILSGVAKYVGFPAAPAITGAEGDALEDDLKSMKITKRVPQATNHSNASSMFMSNRYTQPQSERLAHEQFIEQNAWARPQGTIPNHGTPNLTHTPDWAEAGNATTAKHMARTTSTPATSKRAANSNEDPPQDRKTMKDQSAPPTAERTMAMTPGARDPISPIAMVKQRQNGNDKDVPNFRNFSNISGTSTIDAPDSAEKDKDRMQQHQHHAFERHPVGTLLRYPSTSDSGGRPEPYAALPQPTTSFRPAVMAVSGSPASSLVHKS